MSRLKRVLLLLCFWLVAAEVRAQTPTYRDVHVYASQDFTTGFKGASESVLADRFSTYISHLNAILEKNTDLRLSYSPATHFHLVPQAHIEGWRSWQYGSFTPCPTPHHFAIYLAKRPSNAGQWMFRAAVDEFATVGSTVAIYPPEDGNSTELNPYGGLVSYDFADLCYTILHELAHVHQAGLGEYYAVSGLSGGAVYGLRDFTGTAPVLANESLSVPGEYWSTRQSVKWDPLSSWSTPQNVSSLLANTKFCALTATFINHHAWAWWGMPAHQMYGSQTPYCQVPASSQITVKVTHNGAPIAGATVEMYRVVDRFFDANNYPTSHPGGNEYQGAVSPVYATQTTNGSGVANFVWPSGSPQNGNNSAVLFRVSKTDYVTRKSWLTAWDWQSTMVAAPQDSDGFRYPLWQHEIALTAE